MEWYENKGNFPALITNGDGMYAVVHYYSGDDEVCDCGNAVYDVKKDSTNWRLALYDEIKNIKFGGKNA